MKIEKVDTKKELAKIAGISPCTVWFYRGLRMRILLNKCVYSYLQIIWGIG
jgi:hypothetical protein